MLQCLNKCCFAEWKRTYVTLIFQNKTFENYDWMSYGSAAILYKYYSNTWLTGEMKSRPDSSFPTHL